MAEKFDAIIIGTGQSGPSLGLHAPQVFREEVEDAAHVKAGLQLRMGS